MRGLLNFCRSVASFRSSSCFCPKGIFLKRMQRRDKAIVKCVSWHFSCAACLQCVNRCLVAFANGYRFPANKRLASLWQSFIALPDNALQQQMQLFIPHLLIQQLHLAEPSRNKMFNDTKQTSLLTRPSSAFCHTDSCVIIIIVIIRSSRLLLFRSIIQPLLRSLSSELIVA